MADLGAPYLGADGSRDYEKAMSIKNERNPGTAYQDPNTPSRADSVVIVQDSAETASTPPSELRAFVIIFAICISVFLVAMDTVVLTTALPTISVALEISDSGFAWTGATHMMGNAAVIPFWGKFSESVGRKPTLLLAHCIFMVGSLISALCINLPMLLVGRAMQGAGGGGLVMLANLVINDIFSQRKRTVYSRFVAMTWSIAYAIGPVLGGAFAQYGRWRWCFWINLVCDGVSSVILFLFLTENKTPRKTLLAGLKSIDYLGTLSIMCSTLTILLGLEFGDVNFPWKSVTVLCLILFGVLAFVIFLLIEWKVSIEPLIPLGLFKHRTTAALSVVCFSHGVAYISCAYFLPFYFQSVLGATPMHSGIWFLALTGPLAVTTIGASLYVQKTGKYLAVIRIGAFLLTLGFGLFVTFTAYRSWVRIIMFQLLVALGVGLLFQPPLLAFQMNLQPKDSAPGMMAFGFMRQMSYGISVVIGQLLVQSRMKTKLAQMVGAGIAPNIARALTEEDTVSATPLIRKLTPEQQTVVRSAITNALQKIWALYATVSLVALVASIFVGGKKLSMEDGSISPSAGSGSADDSEELQRNVRRKRSGDSKL